MRANPDIRALCIAGRFLTRLPFPDCRFDRADLGRSVVYYPLVGLLIGVLLAAAGWMLSAWPEAVGATLVLILWIWLTGILHLDGLADSADALIGGLGNRERSLEIMRDPAVGTAGVVSLIMVFLSKWAGLQLLLEHGGLVELLWVPVLSRALLLPLFLTTPCARKEGLAVELVAALPRRFAWGGTALACIGVILTLGAAGVLACGFAAGLVYFSRRTSMKRLGGFTGDTAGATVELIEAGLLVLFSLLAGDLVSQLP